MCMIIHRAMQKYFSSFKIKGFDIYENCMYVFEH